MASKRGDSLDATGAFTPHAPSNWPSLCTHKLAACNVQLGLKTQGTCPPYSQVQRATEVQSSYSRKTILSLELCQVKHRKHVLTPSGELKSPLEGSSSSVIPYAVCDKSIPKVIPNTVSSYLLDASSVHAADSQRPYTSSDTLHSKLSIAPAWKVKRIVKVKTSRKVATALARVSKATSSSKPVKAKTVTSCNHATLARDLLRALGRPTS